MNRESKAKKTENRILVYIEEYNKNEGVVLFDFFDSNEYALFSNLLGFSYDYEKPTMVLITNYYKKRIRENTLYAVDPKLIMKFNEEDLIENFSENSYLIGHKIDASKIEDQIFNESVPSKDNGLFFWGTYNSGSSIPDDLLSNTKGKTSVIIRNVGQGNWNEVLIENEIKVVFDAGAFMNASKSEIVKIIGDRNILYPKTKPTLILSHWDKDHYHSLLGMSNNEIQDNFSYFVCRNNLPTLTSRILFNRIKSTLGDKNTIFIAAESKDDVQNKDLLSPITSPQKRIVIYNSKEHKNRNLSGLIVTVKTKSQSIILSGDASYNQISQSILPHLNYKHKHNIVVPHHGGNAGTAIYNIPKLAKRHKAIISVGKNNYNHPLQSNLDFLSKIGFSISQTNIIGDILVSLD